MTYVKPATHSSEVNDYDVEFLKSDGSLYNATCDEASVTALTCTLDTTTVKTNTGLAVDSLIRVKVRAQNDKGWGAYSEFNSAGALI